jgi:hypothetical protein
MERESAVAEKSGKSPLEGYRFCRERDVEDAPWLAGRGELSVRCLIFELLYEKTTPQLRSLAIMKIEFNAAKTLPPGPSPILGEGSLHHKRFIFITGCE